jgi:hypothetical protein
VKPLFISSVHRRLIKGRAQNAKTAQNILSCQTCGISPLKMEIRKNKEAMPKNTPLMLLLKGTVRTAKKRDKRPIGK